MKTLLMRSMNLSRLILGFGMLGLLAGCSTGPKAVAWNLNINKVTPASIEVDIVGISPSEKPYWMNAVKPDTYWKPNDSIRKGVKKISTNFSAGRTFDLQLTNPIWTQWFGYGTTELMIIANLPGTYDNGPYDRRRIFVPLNKNLWDSKDETIRLEIQDEFIRVMTPQKN